ncbi:MAG: SRPBCC domain-containing protein [Acidobacteriota bacterium]
MANRLRTITQKVVVSASPDNVYNALVSPRLHAEFTGSPATGSARVGGAFTAWGGYISGVHRELVKPSRIVDDWQTTEWPDGAAPSRVVFTLTAVEGGTQIRMVHSHVPADQADAYRQGWIDYYWSPLQAYFTGGRTAGRN